MQHTGEDSLKNGLKAIIGIFALFLWVAGLLTVVKAQPNPPWQSAALAGFTATDYQYLPTILRAPDPPPWVDTSIRQISLDFYMQTYLASEGVAIGWTGNVANCVAGTTSAAFREAVRKRINYFRSMAGVPGDVQLSDTYNAKAQQAALMMSANNQLSHSPPDTWKCYTADGAQAAGSSDLYLGVYGPAAITGYIYDPGTNNYPVGHRRWILYPQTKFMGTGDLPPSGSFRSANALWVFDENLWKPRPATREEFVAWPPPGYVPYQVVFPRWSFSYAGADFSAASVSMLTGGKVISVAVQSVVNGYGENTLVWQPAISTGTAPAGDTTYVINIQGVKIDGITRSFEYQVIVFNPAIQPAIVSSTPLEEPGPPPVQPGNAEAR